MISQKVYRVSLDLIRPEVPSYTRTDIGVHPPQLSRGKYVFLPLSAQLVRKRMRRFQTGTKALFGAGGFLHPVRGLTGRGR